MKWEIIVFLKKKFYLPHHPPTSTHHRPTTPKLHTKIQTTSHWYKKKYTAHPQDMVHVPAKIRENTAMHFRVTVRKLNVTDRQTDGGRFNSSLGQIMTRYYFILLVAVGDNQKHLIYGAFYKFAWNTYVIHICPFSKFDLGRHMERSNHWVNWLYKPRVYLKCIWDVIWFSVYLVTYLPWFNFRSIFTWIGPS